ncbi:MAG: pilus assembly protein [Gemmataceae bacterium]|nr:pilus assembly protein [Gemmataceae bacterium]
MTRYLRAPCRAGKLAGRHGAALVETAAVLIVFLLLLFGVLEYCRFLFMRELIANAAREGARFAVVRTVGPTIESDTRAHVLKFMNGFEGKVKNFTIQVYHGDTKGEKVYSYDPATNSTYGYQSDATGKYLEDASKAKYYFASDATGTYVLDGSMKVYLNIDSATGGVTGANASQWSSFTSSHQIKGVDSANNALFAEYIVVQIDCDYEPILPTLLLLNNTIHLRVRGVMSCEAN